MAEGDNFNYNLQQSEQHSSKIAGNEELSTVKRSWNEEFKASQEVHSKVMQSSANDIHEHLFGLKEQIDIEQILYKHTTLSSRSLFEPLQQDIETDVESFLENEKQNAVLSLIDEAHKNSIQTVEDNKWKYIQYKREKDLETILYRNRPI